MLETEILYQTVLMCTQIMHYSMVFTIISHYLVKEKYNSKDILSVTDS